MYTKLCILSWVVCYYPVSVKRRLRTIVFTMQMSTLYTTTIAPLFSNPKNNSPQSVCCLPLHCPVTITTWQQLYKAFFKVSELNITAEIPSYARTVL